MPDKTRYRVAVALIVEGADLPTIANYYFSIRDKSGVELKCGPLSSLEMLRVDRFEAAEED